MNGSELQLYVLSTFPSKFYKNNPDSPFSRHLNNKFTLLPSFYIYHSLALFPFQHLPSFTNSNSHRQGNINQLARWQFSSMHKTDDDKAEEKNNPTCSTTVSVSTRHPVSTAQILHHVKRRRPASKPAYAKALDCMGSDSLLHGLLHATKAQRVFSNAGYAIRHGLRYICIY